MITIDSTLTKNEQNFLRELIRITPAPYLNTGEEEKIRNYKLLGIAQLALFDANQEPPATGYRFNDLPTNLYPLIQYGTELYLQQLKQMEYSLVDVTYSAAGLSLTIDRTNKIQVPLTNFETTWQKWIRKWKNNVLVQQGGIGLQTPRWNSSMSRAIMALGQGGAFSWNVP